MLQPSPQPHIFAHYLIQGGRTKTAEIRSRSGCPTAMIQIYTSTIRVFLQLRSKTYLHDPPNLEIPTRTIRCLQPRSKKVAFHSSRKNNEKFYPLKHLHFMKYHFCVVKGTFMSFCEEIICLLLH